MPPELHLDPRQIDWTHVIADQEAIRRVNHQRFEMEQLTAIVHIDPSQHLVIGYRDIRADEFWVRGHMPGYPLFPGVLMCEAAAQLCSYYIVTQKIMEGDFIGFGGLDGVRFRAPVRVGDRLLLIGRGTRVNRRQTVCNVQGFVGSTMVFHADVLGVPLRQGGGVSVRRAKRLPLAELAPVLLELAEPPCPYCWSAVFDNSQPVEIEVGFGKGLFLLTATAARPDINFLGIEIVRKYQLFAATRLVKQGRRNVKVACADARAFLRNRVAQGSIQAIHVYFPDPWWKKRHQKRRLFTADFATACEQALRPGGILHVATDVADYYDMVQKLLAEHIKLKPLAPPQEKAAAHDLDYLTNFERKFRKAGKAIYRRDYRKAD